MTTRSLILTAPEVSAALRKELRLVVRPVVPTVKGCKVGAYHTWANGVPVVEPVNVQEDGDPWTDIKCPLGVPGTVLRCKETWAHDAATTEACRRRYEDIMAGELPYGPYFRADPVHENTGLRWRSPATMPAWASRILLEVVTVGVCRLGDLTAQDAMDAGFHGDDALLAVGAFASHFQQKYYPKGIGSDAEFWPWCWKVEVKGVEK